MFAWPLMMMAAVVVITKTHKNTTQEQLFDVDGTSSGYHKTTPEQLVIATASGNASMRVYILLLLFCI